MDLGSSDDGGLCFIYDRSFFPLHVKWNSYPSFVWFGCGNVGWFLCFERSYMIRLDVVMIGTGHTQEMPYLVL